MCEPVTEWKFTTLRNAAKQTKSSFRDGDWIEAPYITDSGIRLIQTGNIGRGYLIEKPSSQKYISKQTFRELRCSWVHSGDILICRLADPIGRACNVPDRLDKSVTSVDVTIMRVNREEFHPQFVLHYLNSDRNLKKAADIAGGSTRSRISRNNLGSLDIPIPPRPQQQKIAQILDTLDTQIQKTETLITKLEKIKEGLLHDLLTRGIDQNGQLRPTPKQAPELYKESAIGLIPLDWHQGTISDYVLHGDGIKPGPFGSSITKSMYRRTGYKIYGQEQVIRADHTFGNYYIGRTKYSELMGFEVQPWDILISLVGTVGKVLVIPENHEPGIINPRLMRLRPNKANCDATFLGQVLTSSFFTRKLIALAGGGTMPVINKRIIQNVALPVIPLLEQTEIRSRVSALLQRLDSEKGLLVKLHTQKSGLMDDLLTGRVRVTPLLKDAV